MYHEDIFYPFLPMFSTFDGKMVNVVENADCFCSTHQLHSYAGTRHSLGDAAGQVHTRPRDHEHLPGRRDKLRLQGGVVLCLHPSMVIIVIVCPASVASTLLTVVIILLGLRIVVILSAACDCG